MKKEATSNSAEDTFQQNANSAFQWFNQSAQIMGDAYKKQLTSTYEIFNSFFENAIDSTRNSFENESTAFGFAQKNMNLFIKNLEMFSQLTKEIMKTTVESRKTKDGYFVVNEDFVDAIYHAYNSQSKHLAAINQNFMDSLNQYSKSFQFDYNALSKNIQKNMEANMEASNTTFKTMLNSLGAFNTKADITDSRFIDEINKQIDMIAKSNIKFWDDMFRAVSAQGEKRGNGTVKEESKESTQESKTSTNAPHEKSSAAKK